jgi:hypothetical protein
MAEDHPAGTIRYRRDGEADYTVCSPHNVMYSTATMLATEYWDVARKEWVKIFEDDD